MRTDRLGARDACASKNIGFYSCDSCKEHLLHYYDFIFFLWKWIFMNYWYIMIIIVEVSVWCATMQLNLGNARKILRLCQAQCSGNYHHHHCQHHYRHYIIIVINIIIIISSLSTSLSLYHLFNQVLQFIGREDVNQYVVISYTMLVSEKAELEIEVVLMIWNMSMHKKGCF